jgi:hypothetical protein
MDVTVETQAIRLKLRTVLLSKRATIRGRVHSPANLTILAPGVLAL